MNKGTFKTIDQVWEALDSGKTVYFNNESYKIYIERNPKTISGEKNPYYSSESRSFSTRNEEMLAVRCISNHFGSVISPSDLSHLFIKKGV